MADANLQKAEIPYAHLEMADLRGAKLEGADLAGAHLDGAKLEGSNLCGADLRGVTGLTQKEQIDTTFMDNETLLDSRYHRSTRRQGEHSQICGKR